jgi:hypothetical protein
VTCAARCGDADPDTLVLADGFSCATQVRDATGRRTLHMAEVLRPGLHGGRAPAVPAPTRRPSRRLLALGAGGAALAALGGVLCRRRARRDELVAEAGTSPPRRTR